MWTDPTDKDFNWRADYLSGRHTYGASVVTGVRIVYGDNERYGGTANLAGIETAYSDPADKITNWA